jgi:beta-galactosidase
MNYKLFLPACLLLLTVTAYAQNNTTGPATLSLNGKWQFQTDSAGVGEAQHWYAGQGAAFKDELTVPGNWNTENRYAAYTGRAWYKRSVFIPLALKGKLIRLNFEGVYNVAKVWVNGQFVMENNLGYLQFEHEVSGLLKYGQNNTIVVSVDNQFKLGALWNWGGIRRPVKLLIGNQVYLAQNHVTPRVDLTRRTARVQFELSLANASTVGASVSGKITITYQHQLLKTIPFKNHIAAGETGKQLLETELNPDEVKLWNLEEPNLYDYQITINKGQAIADKFTGHFGLRVIEMDNVNHQLKLNGKVIRPLGFNLVPDDRTNGNTEPLWRVKEDIDLMKSLGLAVARMSHMPYHQELLDYLDEKGILIFEEIPVWGMSSLVKKDNPVTNEWLRRMISDHYNHPCIAGWSVGNEIGKNPDVMAYTGAAIQLVKKLDTTRLGVTISYTGVNPVDHLQLSDIGFMNSYGRTIHRTADRIHEVHPQSTLFLSEFGLGQLNEDLSSDFPIQTMMDSLRMKPFLIGASLWTFNDYRSTYKDTKEASQNRPWGLVDVARQKKEAFYSFRKANMPVAAFQVNAADLTANGKLTVAIKPRAVFDLPANELDGYRVVLKLMDKTGRLTGGNFTALPVVHPGDQLFSITLDAKQPNSSTFKANVSLVSPQNYVMYDTVIYFQKPIKTRVLNAASGGQTVAKQTSLQPITQIRFEKDGSATGYQLRYHIAGKVTETPITTANNYINLVDVDPKQLTHVELIALNTAGEITTPVPAIDSRNGLLPPLIRYTEAADDAFFMEMETTADDRKFIIQTTDRSGDYSKAITTAAETKGSLKVSGLTNGKMYYYRIKRSGDKGESGWSEEVAVKPDGGLAPANPHIQGVISNGNEAVICFDPVKKSTGYDLLYKSSQETNWHHAVITSAQTDQYQFKIAGSGKIEVKLAAINPYGKSTYTIFQ